MKYSQFGEGKGEIVSKLCLGTAQFGTRISKEKAFLFLDEFSEEGGNFIDTANIYGRWSPAFTNISETIIGDYLKSRNKRDYFVISTKGGHPPLENMKRIRLSERELRKDLESSLNALQTEYIDYYFLHGDDMSIPVSEIIDVMEKFKKEGKIKHYCCSNWTTKRIAEADADAMWSNIEGFSINQAMFSLADVNRKGLSNPLILPVDKKLFQYHTKTKKPLMAYSAMAKGFFTKKLSGYHLDSKLDNLYSNEFNKKVIDQFPRIMNDYGFSEASAVISYIISQDFPVIPIVSFTSISQIRQAIKGCDIDFPKELKDEFNKERKFIY